MNTLITDLSKLIDDQLDCYQAIFLGFIDNPTRWALYFYHNMDRRILNICHKNLQNTAVIDILKRYLKAQTVKGLRSENLLLILKIGLKLGDEELINLVYPNLESDIDKQNAVIKTIKYGHTELFLKYEHPYVEFLKPESRACYDRLCLPRKIVAGYRSKNKQIIEHILTINNTEPTEYDIASKITKLLMMTSITSGDDKQELNKEFMRLYEKHNCCYNIDFRFFFLFLAFKEKNMELYNFLKSKAEQYSHVDAVHLVQLIDDTDINSIRFFFQTLDLNELKSCTLVAYREGKKNIFNHLIKINPDIIRTISIEEINNKMNIDNYKTVLSRAPPSVREIQKLIQSSLNVKRFDIYIYLCSIKHTIEENALQLGQKLLE